jgi:hypothetical protein
MDFKAVVRFEGGIAQYHICPESNGIYQARLLHYDGHSTRLPPMEVILVRGYRQWSGSYERQDFLNEIGSAIERRNGISDPTASG